MNIVERSFRLQAPEGLGAKPRPELIGPVLTELRDTLLDSVRMGFRHSSLAPGRVAAPLLAAADVHYLGHSAAEDHSTLLHFELQTLGDAFPQAFRQQSLWADGPRPDQTAFDLLADSLRDVAAQRRDSTRFDSGLLTRFARYRRLFKPRRLERISLVEGGPEPAAHLDRAVTESARSLANHIPPSQRIRVTGRLDVLGASQGVLKIVVAPGSTVLALWDGSAAIDSLRDLFNRDVVIEGTAVFRPSGGLLRIDAVAIAEATAADGYFRQVPVGMQAADVGRALRLKAGETSAYSKILGRIPAEESDEEFIAAVEAMS